MTGPILTRTARTARTIVIYAAALAIAAAALNWLEYRYAARAFSTEFYVGLLGVGFVALGIWVGQQLTPAPRSAEFRRNEEAIRALGLTPRECEILQLIASGQSNKEMARALSISPNTVKTHIASVYDKLAVERRTQAVDKARWLALIP
jgi:DNA-binding CsgD family transcriptional regulator